MTVAKSWVPTETEGKPKSGGFFHLDSAIAETKI